VPVPAAAASPSQVQVLTGTLSKSRAFVDSENGLPPASDSEGCQWPRTSGYPRAGSIFQVSTWAAARQACPCVGASHRGTTGPRQSRPCAYPALAGPSESPMSRSFSPACRRRAGAVRPVQCAERAAARVWKALTFAGDASLVTLLLSRTPLYRDAEIIVRMRNERRDASPEPPPRLPTPHPPHLPYASPRRLPHQPSRTGRTRRGGVGGEGI
jgi:hypothetical protein